MKQITSFKIQRIVVMKKLYFGNRMGSITHVINDEVDYKIHDWDEKVVNARIRTGGFGINFGELKK